MLPTVFTMSLNLSMFSMPGKMRLRSRLEFNSSQLKTVKRSGHHKFVLSGCF